jgi:uncharacterized protein (TIGR03084 family)
MDEILAGLDEQQAELDALVRPDVETTWSRPSRCDGWTVSDVMLHLAQTNEMALGSLTGTFDETLHRLTEGVRPSSDIDDGAGLMVDKERGAPPADVYDRWRDGVDRMMAAYRRADPHHRVQWVAGQLSVHTLATTRLAETWIHTNDVAYGLGVELAAPERLRHIARLAWRTLPYAFARAGREMSGTVAFELTGPSGDLWRFTADDGAPAATVVRGPAADLCLLAGQRANARQTQLTAVGPDGDDVLELVRTFA